MSGSRHAARRLQATAFLSNADRFLIAPLLVVIARDLHVTLAEAAHVATAYFLAYGVMQAVWSITSDRLGRVRTLRLSLLIAAAGALASAVVPGLVPLVLARALAGAAFAAAVPGALIYVGDTVPMDRRQGALTDVMTAGALGLALAAAAGPVIAQLLDWRAAFALTGLSAVVLSVGLRGMAEPDLPPPAPVRRMVGAVLTSRWALLVVALVTGEGLVLLGFLTFLPAALVSTGSSTTVAGLVTAVYGLAVLGFAQVVKQLTGRVAPAALIALGLVAAAASFVVLALDQHLAGVLVGGVLNGAAWAFMHSTMQAWVTDVVPHARATAVSLFASMLFVGSSIGTAVGARWADAGDFRTLYLVALATIVPVGAVAAITRSRYA